MPVMVVGVDNAVGDRAGRLLAARGGEVRAFVQAGEDADAVDPRTWRDLGCKVAHGDLQDEGHVEAALEQVHTVLALLGRPVDEPDRYLEQVATVISAAIGAGSRRLVLLSDLAVTQPGGNPWLQALADAEDMAADAPMESVVLRAAAIYSPADTQSRCLAGGALGPAPSGSHWPIYADDVAVAAVMADAERELDSALHVVLQLAGPQHLQTSELADALAAVVPAALDAGIPGHAAELLRRDIPRPPDALGAGGTRLDSLRGDAADRP